MSGMHHRLAHIDALRGFAALLVLYQHLLEHAGNLAPAGSLIKAHAEWTLDYLDLGKLGVVIFFAISGYIVPFSFTGPTPRLGFIVSRFFRLYPAYWVSLAAAALLLPLLGGDSFRPETLLANVTMVPTLFRQPEVLGVYWTLLIELFFYALCFALFIAGSLRSVPVLAGVFTVLLAVALGAGFFRNGSPGGAPVGLPLYLAVMLFGTCLRLATLEGDRLARRCSGFMLLALCIVIPMAWSAAYDDHSHRESVLADITAFWLALLIFVAGVLRPIRAPRPLVYAGAISYSVYLMHPLALEIGQHFATRQSWPVSGGLLAVTALALTLAMAHLVHRYVEQPSIRLGRRVAAALSQRAEVRRQQTPARWAKGRSR